MRQPTPGADLYAWHRAAMAGEDPSITEDYPECGWYRIQFKKGAPWIAVEIRIDREIDRDTGELICPERVYSHYLGQRRSDAERIWTWLKPISRDRYKAMVATEFDTPTIPLTEAGFTDLTQEPALP